MGPYRTPPEPPPTRDEEPARDREDLAVHAGITIVGLIGVVAAVSTQDLHAGFTLALIVLVVGVRGVWSRGR